MQRGQGLVEYALVLILLAMVVIVVAAVVGGCGPTPTSAVPPTATPVPEETRDYGHVHLGSGLFRYYDWDECVIVYYMKTGDEYHKSGVGVVEMENCNVR